MCILLVDGRGSNTGMNLPEAGIYLLKAGINLAVEGWENTANMKGFIYVLILILINLG